MEAGQDCVGQCLCLLLCVLGEGAGHHGRVLAGLGGGRGWGVMGSRQSWGEGVERCLSITHFLCLSFPIRALVGWLPTGWNLAVGG